MINRPIYYVYSPDEETYVQVATEEMPQILEGYREIKDKVPFVISQMRNLMNGAKEKQKDIK